MTAVLIGSLSACATSSPTRSKRAMTTLIALVDYAARAADLFYGAFFGPGLSKSARVLLITAFRALIT